MFIADNKATQKVQEVALHSSVGAGANVLFRKIRRYSHVWQISVFV